MTIAFDIDGVLIDLHTPWLDRYNKEHADDLELEDIKEWEVAKFVKPACTDICKYLDPSIYDVAAPINGAVKAVEIARLYGRVIFATNSSFECVEAKFKCLERHGFKPTSDDFVVCKDKGLVRANLLIDDYEKNLYRFVGEKALFVQPWNRHIEDFYPIDGFDNIDFHLGLLSWTK